MKRIFFLVVVLAAVLVLSTVAQNQIITHARTDTTVAISTQQAVAAAVSVGMDNTHPVTTVSLDERPATP
jgi:hypothetical protein